MPTTIFSLPVVVGGIGYTLFPADLLHLPTALYFLQNTDNLAFGMSALLYLRSPVCG